MSLALDLSGRTVLVTGAAGGLGCAAARRVSDAGATVVLSDLAGAPLERVADELRAGGASAHVVPADLALSGAGRALVDRALESAGRLDGLVSCAGVMQTKPLPELTPSDWTRVIDINLNGVFEVTQAAANHMRRSGGGSVVTLASVAARSGRPNAAHYAASKSALVSLTRSAAMAYAPVVRLNAVCPGVFLTPMWSAILAEREAEFGPGAGQGYLDQTLARVPLNRVGGMAELANVVVFLLSELASYITGQAVNVDGGLEMD